MIYVPDEFKPIINTIYPHENYDIFESWVCKQNLPQTEREWLPIQWTAYFVNNMYGKDVEAMYRLQSFINSLPTDKKYATCVQYDDGVLVDVSRLDLLQFNMSENIGVPIPLLCQPHSYRHNGVKNIFASFIGSHTHPIRESIFQIRNDDFYISDRVHDINEFCSILARSTFGLCPRGYGLNSFRIAECMQYNTIPVYISDEFVEPFYIDFNEIGVKIPESQV